MDEIGRESLFELVETYPWFAAARVRLCLELAKEQGVEAVEGLLRESLPFLPDPRFLMQELHNLSAGSFADDKLPVQTAPEPRERQRIRIAGMDYFSKEDYERERVADDASISSMAVVDYSAPAPEISAQNADAVELVSETLARIYAEQGYPELAKEIYNKLSLQSPEKSAYFASLIDNLK